MPVRIAVGAALAISSGVILSAAPASAVTYPYVNLTTPLNGANVKGVVSLQASGSTVPGSGDFAFQISFFVDGGSIGSVTCPASSYACSASMNWDATGLSGTHELYAQLQSQASVNTNSATATVTVTTPSPTVSVTSPVGGTTVKGVVTIDGSASTDASLSDYPSYLVFYVDGVAVGPFDCSGTTHVCPGSFRWDATQVPDGPHQLTVEVITIDGGDVTSSPVSVTVANPPPKVTIAKPLVGTKDTSGTVPIDVVGSTDASLTDFPSFLDVVVDGKVFAQRTCAPTAHSCELSTVWSTDGLYGTKSIVAKLVTANGLRVSNEVQVTIVPAVKILFGSSGGRAGQRTTIRGTLTDPRTHAGLPHQVVTLLFDPVIGRSSIVRVRTDALGRFSAGVALDSNALLTVTSTAVGSLIAGSRSAEVGEHARFACHLTLPTTHAGGSDTLICKAANLPNGVAAYLNYRKRLADGKWGAWKVLNEIYWSQSDTISMDFITGSNGLWQESAYVDASRVFSQTDTPPVVLTVR